jgi:hypothetical protein
MFTWHHWYDVLGQPGNIVGSLAFQIRGLYMTFYSSFPGLFLVHCRTLRRSSLRRLAT